MTKLINVSLKNYERYFICKIWKNVKNIKLNNLKQGEWLKHQIIKIEFHVWYHLRGGKWRKQRMTT